MPPPARVEAGEHVHDAVQLRKCAEAGDPRVRRRRKLLEKHAKDRIPSPPPLVPQFGGRQVGHRPREPPVLDQEVVIPVRLRRED
jgi:hypothetical protein